MAGGKQSLLYRWLSLYLTYQKKINIGFTGSALSDVAFHNSECIELVRANPHIFNPLLRPFSHDISTLRTPYGFKVNFLLGVLACEHFLGSKPTLYLPPEFIITSRQLYYAHTHGINSTLLLRDRFNPNHLPNHDNPICISLVPDKIN